MADWKDRFREGSFRGVGFFIESHQLSGGRRKQDREFARRDVGNSEDLGRRLKQFSIEVLVIGDDYFDQRDALIEAIEAPGSGELIHPYLGTLNVQAGEYTLTETKREQRIARFTIAFTEAGRPRFPDQVEDDLSKASENAGTVKDDSKSFFETVFSVANQPAFVVEAASDAIEAVLDFADDAVKKVTDPIDNFTFAISNLKADIQDLLDKPGELADRLQASFDSLLDEFADEPETAERVFGNFTTLEEDDSFVPVVGDTPSRQKQQENQDAVLQLTQRLTLSNQAQAAVEVDFLSTDAALKSRDAIVQGFDGQLSNVDDELFQSIKDLQSSLTKAIPRIGTSELLTLRFNKTLPALVIAHGEFEDLDKETEIVEQNAVEHPGFVPGGEEILVSAG